MSQRSSLIVAPLAAGVFAFLTLLSRPAPLPAAEPPSGPTSRPIKLPKVDDSYGYLHAGDWAGKTLRQIIEPESIRQIAVLAVHGELPAGVTYDNLVAALFGSDEKAVDWGLRAEESSLVELLVLGQEQVFCLDVVTAGVAGPKEFSAVIVRGAGHAARIPIRPGTLPAMPLPPLRRE